MGAAESEPYAVGASELSQRWHLLEGPISAPNDPGPPGDGIQPQVSPESPQLKRPWPGRDRLGLDRLGLTQAIGGLILGLIALFSSYDHITVAGRSLPIQQQWGIPCIAASVATVLV
jgi:hypothetical protein